MLCDPAAATSSARFAAACPLTSAKVHQVVIPPAHQLGHVAVSRLDRSVSREVGTDIEQRPRAVHCDPLHHRRLINVLGGEHNTVEPRGACGERHGKRPADRTQIPLQTELTQQQEMINPSARSDCSP
jgi:hypothetical protein